MYKDEKPSSDLAELINPFDYLIVDTCSLMDPNFPDWMDILENAREYRKQGQPIYVFYKCFEELKKHAKNKLDDTKRIAAKRALKILRHARRRKLLTLTKKEKNQNFADNAIFVQASTDRINMRLAVITQDNKLASDLLKLNEQMSQRGHNVYVFRIGEKGVLERNRGFRDKRTPANGQFAKQSFARDQKPAQNKHYEPERSKPLDTSAVLAADEIIKIHSGDSSYPTESLIKEVKDQLRALSKFPYAQVKTIPLKVNVTELNRIIRESKPAKQDKPVEAKKADRPVEAKKADKPVEKETPKQETAPAAPAPVTPTIAIHPVQKKANAYSWYGFGHNVKDAVLDVAGHYGIVFRDSTLPYIAVAHGPLDVTNLTLQGIVVDIEPKLKGSESAEYIGKGYSFRVENAFKGFRAYINIGEQKKEEIRSDAPQKAETPAPKPAKTEPVEQKPAAEQPKQPSGPTVQEDAAVPAGASLVVGIPSERVKNRIERKARMEDPSQPAAAPKKRARSAKKASATLEKPESEAKKAPARKPAAKKPAKAKEAENKEPAAEAKPVKKRAAKKAPASKAPETDKAEEKKETKKPAAKKPTAKKAAPKKDERTPFEQAKAADVRLKAVISNSKYSAEDKEKDLEAQLELLKKLTPEQRDELNYGMDAIKGMLAISKGSK